MKKFFSGKKYYAVMALLIAIMLVACSKSGDGLQTDGDKEPVTVVTEDNDEAEASEAETEDEAATEEVADEADAEDEAEAAEVEEAAESQAGMVAKTKYVANTEVLTIKNEKTDYSGLKLIPVRYPFGSSQLEADSENYGKYCADNLFDGKLDTAYVEGVSGDGIGQMINVDFDNCRSYEISRIKVYPGYQKDAKTFNNNSRPTKLSFSFPDGHYFVQEFDYGDATEGYIEIDLNKIFSEKVVAHYCIVTIEDAIRGDKYEDCCISEMEFYEPETASEDVVLINYENEYDENMEKCLITASLGGKTIWNYECKTSTITELTGVRYVSTANGIVYVQDDWRVVALDAMTGEVIWKNDEHTFSASADFYDIATGNIYLSGYYGPDIIGFDREGNALIYEGLDGDCYWPCMMKPVVTDFEKWYNGEGIEHVKIFFDGSMSIEDYDLKKMGK